MHACNVSIEYLISELTFFRAKHKVRHTILFTLFVYVRDESFLAQKLPSAYPTLPELTKSFDQSQRRYYSKVDLGF